MKPSSSNVPRVTGWLLYFCLLFLRFVLVWRVQPGYLHPDEFLQSVEIAAGDVYGLDVFRSWEFIPRGSGPLRSIAGIGPMAHLPVWLYKRLLDGTVNKTMDHLPGRYGGLELINRIVFPIRLMTVVGSLWVDLFILFGSAYLHSPYGKRRRCFLSATPPIALIIYASCTFGGLLLAGRTLANSWESMAVAIFGLSFVMVLRRVQGSTPTTYTYDLIFICIAMSLQAVLSIWAIFLRFTYPIFILPLAVVEVIILLRKSHSFFILPSSIAILVAAVTMHLCLVVDTAYYMDLPFSYVYANCSLSKLVCVPCRFFAYNSDSSHLAEHGLHPRYLHLLVNLPLVVGPVVALLALFPRKPLFSVHSVFWLCLVIPLAFLSTVPHQEARFLIPSIQFIALLAGHRLDALLFSPKRSYLFQIWTSKWGALFTVFWFLQQTALLLLFGTLHQGGLVLFFKSIQPLTSESSATCHNYIYYHTYMPPRFPFSFSPHGSNGDQCNSVIDLMGSDVSKFQDTLEQFTNSRTSRKFENVLLHLIYPGSLSPLAIDLTKFGTILTTKLFFGHLSFEDPPRLLPANQTVDYSYWYSQLSLHVVSLAVH